MTEDEKMGVIIKALNDGLFNLDGYVVMRMSSSSRNNSLKEKLKKLEDTIDEFSAYLEKSMDDEESSKEKENKND